MLGQDFTEGRVKMISVAILLDPKNNWIEPFLPESWGVRDEYHLSVVSEEALLEGYDLVFVLGYTRLLPAGIIQANGLVLVVHESDLPKGRGFAPVQWQILEGKNRIRVCLVRAEKTADSGDIYETSFLSFDGTELYDEIRERQAETTIELIRTFLCKYPDVIPSKQNGTPTFFRKRTPLDSKIDVEKPISSQFDLLRTVNNRDWPAYFDFRGQRYVLKIEKSRGF